MLRNKEFAVLFLSLTAISAVGVAVLFSESALAAGIGAFFFLLLLITVLLITRGRYKKIQALSDTLRRVNRGDYSLHPEEGQEGELSILQSEIYKTVLMLKQQNELLEKDKSFLADSLSDISHQLKTPSTSMFVMTDLLCDSKLSDEKRTEFTDNIRQQLQRMQWLIESLLKLSKLDAKTISFHIRGTTPKMLVDKALAPLLIPAELKNVTFEFSSDEKPFSCDINWTVEALVNILKNCLEHTPANGIIKIRCNHQSRNNKRDV